MRLQRPNKINISKRATVEVPQTFEYLDSVSGIKLLREVSVLFVGEEYKKGGKKIGEISFNTNLLLEEQMKNYVSMQNLVQASASSAEDIKSRLLEIHLQLLESSDQFLKEPTEQNRARKALMKLEFMVLKDKFLEHIKQDQLIKKVDEYNSNGKLKNFRRDFDAFVIDRNIFTHGRLLYLAPTFEFVIKYIDNQTKQLAYAFITYDEIVSYNNFYKEILRLLDAYRTTREESENKGGLMWAMIRFHDI